MQGSLDHLFKIGPAIDRETSPLGSARSFLKINQKYPVSTTKVTNNMSSTWVQTQNESTNICGILPLNIFFSLKQKCKDKLELKRKPSTSKLDSQSIV